MTQDGHGGHGSPSGAAVAAGAERISASIDSLAEALLGPSTVRHSPDALFSGPSLPGGPALFDTWLTRTGHGRLARTGAGTVVSCASTTPAAATAGTVEALMNRYGRETVRGVPYAQRAAAFHLPVSAEPSAARLRPAFAAPLAELAAGRQTLAPAELPTGSGLEVRFALPPAFHALTVRGTDEASAEQLGEVAEELFAADGTTARRDWAVLNAALLDENATAGVRFAALAAVRIDGRPSNASLVVALHRDRTPIAELAAELATSRPQAEVWTVILPSGPAVVLVQGRTGAVPAMLTEDGTRRWVVSSVVQAFLPLPDGASLLTVQLGTAHGEDWELYATVFAELLRSVEFGWDGMTAPVVATVAAPVAPMTRVAPAAAPAGPPAAAPAPAPPPTAPPAPAPLPVPPPPPMPPAPPAPPAPPTTPPPAPAPAPAPAPVAVAEPATAAPAPAPAPAPGKGTPVSVPPPDFNPFAPATEPTPAPAPPTAAPAPASAAAAPEPAPQVLDPFGTVMKSQPLDPFGTVTRNTATAAAPPPAPVAAPAAPAAPGKGTPVNVPPADFNPFAPPTEPTRTPAAEAEQPASGKGTPVNVPPADFDPFAPANAAPPAPISPSTEASAPSKPDPFS